MSLYENDEQNKKRISGEHFSLFFCIIPLNKLHKMNSKIYLFFCPLHVFIDHDPSVYANISPDGKLNHCI